MLVVRAARPRVKGDQRLRTVVHQLLQDMRPRAALPLDLDDLRVKREREVHPSAATAGLSPVR